MEKEVKEENIDLILDEVDKPIDKALFIISNVYYCIRNFYHDKYIVTNPEEFPNYLNSFKNKFHKKTITDAFTFNLLDKFADDNSIDNISDKYIDNASKGERTKDEIYYDLLYKRLINIINEEMYFNKEEYIDSTISLRNCFIFLEYLYLFLKEYPNKISHYIIKIYISLLLVIPQKTSKRLINSDEFFYLNLIELKGLFPEIKYCPSLFIFSLDKCFSLKHYRINIDSLKIQKLITLENQLSNLLKSLSKFNSNESSMLYDNLHQILKNLSKDFSSIFANNDELIKKYIFNKNNCEKKTLNNILKEINYKDNIMPNFNYLYLLALNNFKEIQKEDDNKKNKITNGENEINTDIINKNKGNISKKDDYKIEEKKLINSKDKYEKIINKSINLTECEIENDILKQKTENLIRREDLILTINSIEGNLLGLKLEEIKKYEDKYEEYIDRNFTYNRVLNLIDTNIYNNFKKKGRV